MPVQGTMTALMLIEMEQPMVVIHVQMMQIMMRIEMECAVTQMPSQMIQTKRLIRMVTV